MDTILDAIPTDFASLFTLALVVGAAVVVVVAGRSGGKAATKDEAPRDTLKDPE